MNEDWVNFLKSNNAFPAEDPINNKTVGHQTITALQHLAILKVTGADAATFLQGQLTCNINELTEQKACFTAFCNAKGRAISTLLIFKTSTGFLIILPQALISKVSQKLQMYIMRSAVKLEDVSNELCIMGVNTQQPDTLTSPLTEPFSIYQDKGIYIKFPYHNRYLVISTPLQAIALWSDLTTKQAFIASTDSSWVEQDISAGIPWLTQESSEGYIPQMLNIDKLGGISFNKGCYTGQEIIARTHYLGKTKRELFLAYCDETNDITIDTPIMTDISEQIAGNILSLHSNGQQTKLLIVLRSTDLEAKNLILNNLNKDKLYLTDFQ